MPAPDRLYVNLTDKQWALSYDQPSTANPPVFFYKDNRDFSLTFLRMLDSRTAEVFPSVVGVKVGLLNGTTTLTSATQAAIEGNEFRIVLPISGTAMDSFMNLKTTDQLVSFHVKLTTDLGTNRYKFQAYISPEGITDTVPDPTIDEPAVTMSQVTGVCLTKVIPADGFIIMTDAVDGSQQMGRLYNKQLKWEPLS